MKSDHVKETLELVDRMVTEALPKFDWGKSPLDSNAIFLLNAASIAVTNSLSRLNSEASEFSEVRTAVADLIASAGCGCCRDYDGWYAAQARLATLLDVPEYSGGGGYDFYSFCTS